MLLIMTSFLAFIAIALLMLGLATKSERRILQERLTGYMLSEKEESSPIDLSLQKSFYERQIVPLLHKISDLGNRITPAGAYGGISTQLEAAGNPMRLGVKEYFALRIVSFFFFTILGIVLSGLVNRPPMQKITLVAIAALLGAYLPIYLLNRAIMERRRAIRRALPDAIDLLIVSVEAGIGFDGAVAKLVDKTSGPLAQEFARVLEEVYVGKSRVDALKGMAFRANVPELTTFVAAIYQADELGVSVAKVLRAQGAAMRQARSQRAREVGAKLPVKMLIPLVFFIFPAIFVVILGPGAMSIMKSLGGK